MKNGAYVKPAVLMHEKIAFETVFSNCIKCTGDTGDYYLCPVPGSPDTYVVTYP